MNILLLSQALGNAPDAIKGFYLESKRIRTSTVNYDLPEAVQRIVVAHELGHAVLHLSLIHISMADIEKDGYLEEARERYGSSGARDVDQLLRDNAALFAGGELSQEQKDQFFEAVMRAYVACKDEAKVKFGRKNK